MEKYNFSEPTRQSARGIIISVLIAFGSQIKKGIFLFGIVIFQWLKRPELVKSYALELGGVFGIVVGFLIIKEILRFN